MQVTVPTTASACAISPAHINVHSRCNIPVSHYSTRNPKPRVWSCGAPRDPCHLHQPSELEQILFEIPDLKPDTRNRLTRNQEPLVPGNLPPSDASASSTSPLNSNHYTLPRWTTGAVAPPIAPPHPSSSTSSRVRSNASAHLRHVVNKLRGKLRSNP